jgi:hypothetical protein
LIPASHQLQLAVHPDNACFGVSAIEVAVDLVEPTTLRLRYNTIGETRGLRIRSPSSPTRQDGLWQHTCFEVFVKGSTEAYCEFNFSPSREWAAYCFDAYRSGMRPAQLSAAPRIQVESVQGDFELEAVVDLNGLGEFDPDGPMQIGLAAVIEDSAGSLSYWALSHPPGKADFHHPDGFVLALKDNGAQV